MMKRSNCLSALLLTALLLTGCASGQATGQPQTEQSQAERPHTEIVMGENGTFTSTYAGISHACIIDLPEQPEHAPLIMMLHGYCHDAESFRSELHFEQPANARGYAVAYVTGAPDPNDSTSGNGWNSGLGAEGNPDTEFLSALTNDLQEIYTLDSQRIYAVGYSNGAFMTHRLAMEAQDTFSAVVCVAGMMPKKIWDNRNERNAVGFFQITGEKDNVVPKHSDGSAERSPAPAIEDVMQYWADSNGLAQSGTEEIGNGSQLTKYSADGTQRQVWHLWVKNGRHSIPSEQYNGIDAAALILDYLDTQNQTFLTGQTKESLREDS